VGGRWESQEALQHVVLDDLVREVFEEDIRLLLVDIERGRPGQLV
jgi:hypothetical protein